MAACDQAAAPIPSPTAEQTAVPVAAPPGSRGPQVTPCAEVPTPGYLPSRSGYATSTRRMASSGDIVTLEVPDLRIDGQPAQLVIAAQAAPRAPLAGQPRQIGGRAATMAFTGGLDRTPAPPGQTPEIRVRSEVVVAWTESDATCPAFEARLVSSGTNRGSLEAELAKIVASLPLIPRASGTPAAPAVLPETEAWSRVRALFETGPVAVPVWLPPEVARSTVELRGLSVSPTREYEIAYRDAAGADIVIFRLGPIDQLSGSAIGFCCVRGARASLRFASYLFEDPARPGTRRIQWEEQTRILSFRTERIKGEDMLRIAWALDRTTAPPNPYPDARAKIGACASGADPAETVRRLLSLAGSSDRAAVLDCYALDRIMVAGTGIADWAELPSARDVTVRGTTDIAGRAEIPVSWTFSRDPGGAWGTRPSQFMLLGLEDGRWRIYDAGTGPFGRPP